MSSIGNIFLSRSDLDSLTAPKNHLEPDYSGAYQAWKDNNNDATRENLLTTLSPMIDKYVQGISGGNPNYLRMQAKILAMNSMTKYDPTKSSLATYLNHQLAPLRRTSRQQLNVLGLPDRLLMASRELESAETELADELGRLPTTAELSDRLSMSPSQIERVRRMSHSANTGSFLTQNDEGQISEPGATTRRLPETYRHQYVLSALHNDPKSALIYEHDQGLHGRSPLSTAELAKKIGLTPGAVSQRRNRIDIIRNNAEREIYGHQKSATVHPTPHAGSLLMRQNSTPTPSPATLLSQELKKRRQAD